jgi:signal transduction histidine kinase
MFALSNLQVDSVRARRCRWLGQVGPVFAALLLLVWAPEASAEGASDRATNALLGITSVTVDGNPVSPRPVEKVRLSSHTRMVSFGFGPATNGIRQTIRVRFKLDGYDSDWREAAGDMRMCIRFLGDTGDQVSESIFRVIGQSADWTGNPETSSFTHRRETIVVPARATSFWVVMTSAGPPATVGVYAITNLVIKTGRASGGPPKVCLPWALDPAAGGTAAGSAPAGWMRDGLRPSMASVFESATTPQTQGLVIVDDDPRGHAEWHTIKERATPVTPGDSLILEWDEAYSFGLADTVEIPYAHLPAGYYRFRVNEMSLAGIPGNGEVSLAVEMPLVFWRTPWFWVSVVTLILAAGVGGWRYVSWRRRRLEMQRLEQHLALDRERLRIAQDIHDDLGARVTQISLLSAMAQGKTSLPEEARTEFGKVSQMTRDLVSALYETVWVVNPENDNLDALVSYLCQMSNQQCAQAQLRCRLEIPESPPAIPLSSQIRHNLSMAVKESLHNIIKHAHATEVRLRITFEASTLAIWIHDDGRGFDPADRPEGNGLRNLERRLRDIGGTASVESRIGVGTTVLLRLPVGNAVISGDELPGFGDDGGRSGGPS